MRVMGCPRYADRSGADCKTKDASLSAAAARAGLSIEITAVSTQMRGICPSRMSPVLHQTALPVVTSRAWRMNLRQGVGTRAVLYYPALSHGAPSHQQRPEKSRPKTRASRSPTGGTKVRPAAVRRLGRWVRAGLAGLVR